MILVWYALILFIALEIGILLIKASHKNLPPGPKWHLPIIGDTKMLRELAKKFGGQYEALKELSRRYSSPIISLKLGNELVIYVSSYECIKEIYTNSVFDGRPDNFFLRLRTMGSRLGITCTDGELWKEQRSFVVRQLRNVGFGRQPMEAFIQSELKEILEILEEKGEIYGGESNIIATSVINILWTFTCGSKFDRSDPRLKRLFSLLNKRAKVFDMSGGILSKLPWLRFFAPESTGFNLINNLNKEFYELFMEVIGDHLNDYSAEKSGDDLIYAYLKELKLQENDLNSTFTIKQLVMVILDIFIAGSSTTSATIDLFLLSMLLYPNVQKKCREEIENVENLTYSNREAMIPYTVATILESQRFFCITPITGPRRTFNTTNFFGYEIPKNSTILIGSKSILEDEDFWKDPESFRPERFLDSDNKLVPSLLERVLTFGNGKRRCLGDQLAKQCIFYFITGILGKFRLYKDPNVKLSSKLVPGIIYTPQKFKITFEK